MNGVSEAIADMGITAHGVILNILPQNVIPVIRPNGSNVMTSLITLQPGSGPAYMVRTIITSNGVHTADHGMIFTEVRFTEPG